MLHITIHTVYSTPTPYVQLAERDAPIIAVEDDAGGVYEVIHCETADDLAAAISEAQFSFCGSLPVQLGS